MKPLSLSQGALFALKRLESHGYEAYVVGGCVRDSLLGRIPNDWDLTTNATPEETATVFADCTTVGFGKKHGTMMVVYRNEPLEITTYRLDGRYQDHRHPSSVTFSKRLSDDLSRRDFTINAMAYHPDRGLVDLFGGQEDLKRQLVRCVGVPNARFEEDGLRILRAVRFASVLGFSLESETSRAVSSRSELLAEIAGERIREEWNKLLLGIRPVEILQSHASVLPYVVPGTAFDWSKLKSSFSSAPVDLPTRFAIFLSCGENGSAVSSSKAREILDYLRYDGKTKQEILSVIQLAKSEFVPSESSVRRLLVTHSPDTLRRSWTTKRCLELTCPAEAERILETVLARNDCTSLSNLAVSGSDLLAIGIPAGKQLGSILAMLLDEVIEGNLPNSKAALLDRAKKMLDSP